MGGQGSELRRPRLRLVLVAVALALFCLYLDFFALNLAVPGMARDLGTSVTDLQWVISGYMLAAGALFIAGGRLGDIFGRRRVLLCGVALFGTASLLCGLAPSVEALVGFRVLQGTGAALVFPNGVACLTNAYPPERRARAIGVAFGFGALGTALGPFVGGALTAGLGWRWVFWLNVPFATAAIALAAIAIPESRDPGAPRRIDLPGLASLGTGLAALTYAVDQGQSWGWGSPATLGLAGAGLVLLVGFVVIERRVRRPLVELSLLRNIPYVTAAGSGTATNIAYAVTVFVVTLDLQQVRGFSPLQAGALFLAPSAAAALAGPLAGRLTGRLTGHLPATRTVLGANLLGGLGLLALTTIGALPGYVVVLGLCGFGFGAGMASATIATQGAVRPERAGEASGVLFMLMTTLGGIAVVAAGTGLELLETSGHSPQAAVALLLRVVAVTLVVAAVAAYARTGAAHHRRSRPEATTPTAQPETTP